MVKNRFVYANKINEVAENKRAGVSIDRFIWIDFNKAEIQSLKILILTENLM